MISAKKSLQAEKSPDILLLIWKMKDPADMEKGLVERRYEQHL
jgi:hypothetical protein